MRHGLLILRGSFRCLIHTGINADKSQTYAQRAYMINSGRFAMVLGSDDENGPRLFKCDPADQFFGHKIGD
ncbi:hypothetical protein L6452_13493 [Arctium lappa]|uniref:Uncharacterized protein n=1 Tax=Arctium lappa TaxID=4217 RepID=A0ACB9CI91_ARCLA|nr:hypothetical protein L6452_13493 [Arctium lappa]